MDTGQGRSSLLFHLGQAHSKISSLEDYIRYRERQFRSVVGQFEWSDSNASSVAGGGARLRRVGLSHNLLHLHSVGHEEEEGQDESECSNPLPRESLKGMVACSMLYRISAFLLLFVEVHSHNFPLCGWGRSLQ